VLCALQIYFLNKKVPANKPMNAHTCTIIFKHSKMHRTKLIGT